MLKLKLASTMWVVSLCHGVQGENRILEILAEGAGSVLSSTPPPPLSLTTVAIEQLLGCFVVAIRDGTTMGDVEFEGKLKSRNLCLE